MSDSEFVNHIREIADDCDSDFLREVADNMKKLIKENYDERDYDEQPLCL